MAETSTKSKPSTSAVPLIATLVLGVGSGLAYGLIVAGPPSVSPGAQVAGDLVRQGPPTNRAKATLPPAMGSAEHVVPLAPILVNIGGSSGRWLRMEGALAFSQPPKEDREALIARVAEDFLGFLRSTSPTLFDTAAGLEHLREDLADLARIRTKGRARAFILRSLVIE